MELAFSTAGVHPRDRFAFWHAATSERVADHDAWSSDRENFAAELSIGRVGPLGLVTSRNSPVRATCTTRQAAESDPNVILLFCSFAGRILLEQSDRRVAAEPGSLLCVDPRIPHTVDFPQQSSMAILKVPRTELEARLGLNLDIAGRCITPMRPQDHLTLLFAANLPKLNGTLDRTSEETIGTHALEQIALSLGASGDSPRATNGKAQLIWRIHRAIEARLQSTALCPQGIAEQVGISVRHANKLLAEEGSSLMRLVQAKRLARCRQALEDPGQAHRPVSEIAFGWGFSDLTHFSRSFRKTYGMLPSDLRRQSLRV
ncbi:MAG: helix-turn-helix domain-containing protein [Bradyrhizobium sp.]|jgi:AraC-like DNA-binding protein|uniref:helix-turn-helix domain-containing protein n=1 Tax=Bradyrhizobium sp. TaxID=376 RepID=UPI001A1D96E5|nr:helix-turn-helix domain-containing protein [Bradyrhizobium sp.]MBJ7405075.1 helix-turn-helix domain-containing protein [Bradyrhizobium sp.]